MKRITLREIHERNLNIEELPDDTEIVLKEKYPKYILEPFRIVFKGDPEYDKGISLYEVVKSLNNCHEEQK